MYQIIKDIHLMSITLSILLFTIRGLLMIFSIRRTSYQKDSTLLYQHQYFKKIPPVIDSILLISGITLMLISHQYPWTYPWLAVKLIGLLIYILLGILALNRKTNVKSQIIYFYTALFTVSWMISIAILKNPLGYFSIIL